jgi:hypothetical protein
MEWLCDVGIDHDGNDLRNHAARIEELVLDAMTPGEYKQWGRDHGWVNDAGEWDCGHPRSEVA